MGLFDWLKMPKEPRKTVELENWKVNAIQSQMKNLTENLEVVNTSSNYDSAVTAFDAACTALRFLSDFTDEEIRMADCVLDESPALYLSNLLKNKGRLLEKAQARSNSSRSNQMKFVPKQTQTKGTSFPVNYPEGTSLYNFISASSDALNARGDSEKLRQLENLLPAFATFVKDSFNRDGNLPPYVPCRDILPELYMRYGEWEKAEHVIRLCMSCGAYGCMNNTGRWMPETGDTELSTLYERYIAADAALSYLSENPGTIQSKMYKISSLSEVNHDALVWFCRYSHQIQKEKDGKSNRLYVAKVLR